MTGSQEMLHYCVTQTLNEFHEKNKKLHPTATKNEDIMANITQIPLFAS
jgi:hypothetical protein